MLADASSFAVQQEADSLVRGAARPCLLGLLGVGVGIGIGIGIGIELGWLDNHSDTDDQAWSV